jgi:membrane-associated protease RseP (regulator of RpoE activity)
VSSDFPAGLSGPGFPSALQDPWQPPPRFQHRYWIHILLFLLAFGTTTLAFGLWYSVPVLLILGAHEFGHYILCRIHRVDATLPYFIPAPPNIVLTGTFGAVIRIREAFPSKRALFDIGIAGPIAGFLMLLPLLFWGVSLSELVPIPREGDIIYFGEPLLYKFAAWAHFGRIPEGYDVSLHPMAFAAWWGMLATALNLLPFGQLDGGHVIYSIARDRRHAAILSGATLLAAGVLTFYSLSWVSMLVIMVVMAMVIGLQHPRVIDEDTPLDPGRRLLALFALVMFALCFTPVPIQTFLRN